MTETWPASVFDRIHREREDPWRVHDSPYERAKYDATLAALTEGAGRLGSVLEVGCSIGAMTRRLAGRADAVVAIDGSAVALARARDACAGLANVRLAQGVVPADWPETPAGGFDAILFSEVLYFLSPEDLAATARAAAGSVAAEGRIVLVNWTGETDTPLTGEEAAEGFVAAVGWPVTARRREPGWRLEVLRRG